MFLSFLPLIPPFGTALAFLAGGAAGGALMRVVRSHPTGSTLSLVEGDPDVTMAAAQPIGEPMRRSPAPLLERAALAPRTRTGRLPLPRSVTALTPTDEPSLARVNVFADRLAALPFQEWLDVGRSQLAHATRTSPRTPMFAVLEATIATHGLGIAAWYTRDTVETAAFLATNGAPRQTASERRVIAAAHGAAEVAALALLARDTLPPTDFATLYAPFEHVLSSGEVIRLAASRHCER